MIFNYWIKALPMTELLNIYIVLRNNLLGFSKVQNIQSTILFLVHSTITNNNKS